jgi:hypothetical protein
MVDKARDVYSAVDSLLKDGPSALFCLGKKLGMAARSRGLDGKSKADKTHL